jgi:hypothetical protein
MASRWWGQAPPAAFAASLVFYPWWTGVQLQRAFVSVIYALG